MISKKRNPKVSIIVPIYNVEKYLPKCIESLICQTFENIEIWAISDGSPDNSVNIIKEYQKKDKRIKCIEKENGGYGSVLQYAIKNIKTEYFLICDPDDWLKEDAIEILYNTAVNNKTDIVVGAKYLVYNDTEEIRYDASILNYFDVNIESNKKYTFNSGLEKAFFLTPSPHSKLYKTKLAQKIKFPNKVSFTDFLLYTVYLNNCKNFVYIDKALSYYLTDRPGNSMTDINPRIFDYHEIVFNSIMKQVGTKGSMYFYLRMFDQFRYIANLIKSINDDEEKSKRKNQIYNILISLYLYKKQILKCNNMYINKKIRIYNKFLLNKFISKYLFNRLTR